MEINIPSGERTGYEAERTMLFLRRFVLTTDNIVLTRQPYYIISGLTKQRINLLISLILYRMLRHASQARKGIFRLNSPSTYLSLRESCTIPWTENHFKSIKVDLSEATKKGWRLDRVQDFAEFFDCKFNILVFPY